MKTGILWDLDGTLLDTLDDLTDSVNFALSAFGYPLRTRQEVRQFVGNGARNLILRALPEDRQDDLERTLEAFREHYGKNARNKTCPYHGVTDALRELGEKYPIAVVSNKPDGAVRELCALYFPGVCARGERPDCPRKPAPDVIYAVMAELGVERCVYVGDSEVDIRTAENAGVPCLSVTWGFREGAALLAAGAKALCRQPGELVQCIEELIKERF